MAAELLSDFPERFADRKRVYALDAKGQRRELQVEDFWPHKGRIVLKFAGVDSINDAETLAGCEIQIPRVERAELEAGAHYIGDLVGSKIWVTESGRQFELGELSDVVFGAGEAPLLIVKEGNTEHMIPFAEEFVKQIDTAGKKIELLLPEGMLEINSPLTSEEKKQQQGDR